MNGEFIWIVYLYESHNKVYTYTHQLLVLKANLINIGSCSA